MYSFFRINLIILGWQQFFHKIKKEKYRFPKCLLTYMCTASPITNITHQKGTFVTIRELPWHVRITQSPQFTLVFILGVIRSVGFDEYITYIHHYSIILDSFTALIIPCAFSIYFSLSHPQPPETTYLFTLSIVLPFPQCHRIRIIQYMDFKIGSRI